MTGSLELRQVEATEAPTPVKPWQVLSEEEAIVDKSEHIIAFLQEVNSRSNLPILNVHSYKEGVINKTLQFDPSDTTVSFTPAMDVVGIYERDGLKKNPIIEISASVKSPVLIHSQRRVLSGRSQKEYYVLQDGKLIYYIIRNQEVEK